MYWMCRLHSRHSSFAMRLFVIVLRWMSAFWPFRHCRAFHPPFSWPATSYSRSFHALFAPAMLLLGDNACILKRDPEPPGLRTPNIYSLKILTNITAINFIIFCLKLNTFFWIHYCIFLIYLKMIKHFVNFLSISTAVG